MLLAALTAMKASKHANKRVAREVLTARDTVALILLLFRIEVCTEHSVCYFEYVCILWLQLCHSQLKASLGLFVDQQHNLLCTLVRIPGTFNLM